MRRDSHLGFNESYGLTTTANRDHVIVLVDEESQKIVDETSLVVLKTDASNLQDLPYVC